MIASSKTSAIEGVGREVRFILLERALRVDVLAWDPFAALPERGGRFVVGVFTM